MPRFTRLLPLAILGLLAVESQSTQAQMTVQGAKTVITNRGSSVVERETIVIRRRRAWRERNPYFVARPNYAPAAPGQRASVTFEPFTALYHPTTNSYYPPPPVISTVAPR